MSLFKRAADSANMADIMLHCYDAISSTARTQQGHLRFVQDILQTRWREAEAEARVAQLRCRRIAKYFDALCKRQLELKQKQRTAERVRLHYAVWASSLHQRRKCMIPQRGDDSDLSVHSHPCPHCSGHVFFHPIQPGGEWVPSDEKLDNTVTMQTGFEM